jgi:cell division protein FtsQ
VNTKLVIRRIVFVTITLVACSGLIVLLVAAIEKKNREVCKDFTIRIKESRNNLFIDEKDVAQVLLTSSNGKVKGKAIASFNLQKIEKLLESNEWIKNAELYFDNQDVLHVSVSEREPIARIFTTAGNSFYIDSCGTEIPLSEKMSARVPVFTNFPDKKRLSDKDSLLLTDIKKTAWFILNDPFWMSQVEQVDIADCGFKCWSFEMVPTVGNHIVKLGSGGDDIDQKFHRLFVFYQQVMSKAGFDKYNVVDVEYAGQVVASKTKMNKVDSLQLKKNVDNLLREAVELQSNQQDAAAEQSVSSPEQTAPQISVSGQMKLNPKPGPTRLSGRTLKTNMKKPDTKPNPIKRPKAVMPGTN